MKQLSTTVHRRPSRSAAMVGFIAVALVAAATPQAAIAQSADESQATVTLRASDLGDARTLDRVRRQVAAAASELCNLGGIAAVYANQGRRCREQAIADAERQIRARTTNRMAARSLVQP